MHSTFRDWDGESEIRGNLGLGTLPALIQRLYREQASGVLRVTLGAFSRRLYFLQGRIVFANSEQFEDRLGARLVGAGMIGDDDLALAIRRQAESGGRIGQALVSQGTLSGEQVLGAVEEQVREIVAVTFALHCGDYVFERTERPPDEDLILRLSMEEILLDGVRAIDDPIAIRIGVGAMTDTLVPTRITPEGIELNEDESFVLSRLDTRVSILDVLSMSSMDETRTLRAVCALLTLGIVVSEPAPTPKRLDLGEETQPVSLVDKLDAVRQSSEHIPLSQEQRKQSASRFFDEGQRLFEGGCFHDAISALQEAVRLDETRADYFSLLGHAMGKNPHWTDFAIDYLERAIELDALAVDAHWHLALMYERTPERRHETTEILHAVLALDPDHAGARSKLAAHLEAEPASEVMAKSLVNTEG